MLSLVLWILLYTSPWPHDNFHWVQGKVVWTRRQEGLSGSSPGFVKGCARLAIRCALCKCGALRCHMTCIPVFYCGKTILLQSIPPPKKSPKAHLYARFKWGKDIRLQSFGFSLLCYGPLPQLRKETLPVKTTEGSLFLKHSLWFQDSFDKLWTVFLILSPSVRWV